MFGSSVLNTTKLQVNLHIAFFEFRVGLSKLDGKLWTLGAKTIMASWYVASCQHWSFKLSVSVRYLVDWTDWNTA